MKIVVVVCLNELYVDIQKSLFMTLNFHFKAVNDIVVVVVVHLEREIALLLLVLVLLAT